MAESKKSPAVPPQETVLRELRPLGRYRVRLLESPRGERRVLDIREHVETEMYSGFTRRGIRLEVPLLTERLREILAAL